MHRTSFVSDLRHHDLLQRMLANYAQLLNYALRGPVGTLDHYYEGKRRRETPSGEITLHVCACGEGFAEQDACFEHVREHEIEEMRRDRYGCTPRDVDLGDGLVDLGPCERRAVENRRDAEREVWSMSVSWGKDAEDREARDEAIRAFYRYESPSKYWCAPWWFRALLAVAASFAAYLIIKWLIIFAFLLDGPR